MRLKLNLSYLKLDLSLTTILIATAVIAVSFFVSLKAMDWLAPGGGGKGPVLTQLPPLPPVTRNSRVVAPVTIALSAIRDAAERGTPRTYSGKADNPISQLLQNADIGWTASRGTIAASGAQDTLSLTTPLTGTLNVTGSLTSKATGAVGDAIGGLLGGNAAKQIGSINIKNLNVSGEIRGNVVVTSRPRLAAAWRIEPNLAAQVNLGDTSLNAAGARINVPAQVKPLIDKTVAEQIAVVQARMKNDPAFEQNARAAMGQSLPLASAAGHQFELEPAAAVARAEAGPCDRSTAAHRNIVDDPHPRHRGRDPHHAG